MNDYMIKSKAQLAAEARVINIEYVTKTGVVRRMQNYQMEVVIEALQRECGLPTTSEMATMSQVVDEQMYSVRESMLDLIGAMAKKTTNHGDLMRLNLIRSNLLKSKLL